MDNLFGENISNSTKETIELNLYCDEIKNKECPINREKWHYFGVLIVPVKKERTLLVDLLKKRFLVENLKNLNKDNKYFSKNNRIVHFNELGADTYFIAKRWHEYILDQRSCENIYFNIFGINQNKMNPDNFGNKNLFERMYNRFFRTAVSYPITKYFPGYKIVIKNIFHEIGDQEYHEFFPWHVLYKINEDYENISCLNERIVFLDKDHEKSNRANFIQFIDMILGAMVNMFHNSTENEHKVKLTDDFSELTKRLIESPDNPRSYYCKNYYKRMNISFFPDKLIGSNSEEINRFFKTRDMVFLNRQQVKLF